ncbi:hypothetical protein BGAL_0493g00080 [Botrytis galanthina]|uniref:Uncharacterized protein n=1 Tax=Botrytis galanthina TaxID=278940 RepID=A0A4S8QKC7_9HELO|nr:hypothetical protein BGAL_0493g00080 [Botrytis galanthina]
MEDIDNGYQVTWQQYLEDMTMIEYRRHVMDDNCTATPENISYPNQNTITLKSTAPAILFVSLSIPYTLSTD